MSFSIETTRTLSTEMLDSAPLGWPLAAAALPG